MAYTGLKPTPLPCVRASHATNRVHVFPPSYSRRPCTSCTCFLPRHRCAISIELAGGARGSRSWFPVQHHTSTIINYRELTERRQLTLIMRFARIVPQKQAGGWDFKQMRLKSWPILQTACSPMCWSAMDVCSEASMFRLQTISTLLKFSKLYRYRNAVSWQVFT